MDPQSNQDNYWQDDQQASSNTDYPQDMYQPEVDEDTEVEVEDQQPAQPNRMPDEPPVKWVAQEYVVGDKGTGWYAIFTVVVISLIVADIFLLKSWLWSFSFLVVVMALSLIVYNRRPPRDIQYTLSGRQGLYIGERLYHLTEFKSFGLIKDGDRYSIMLLPIKRFASGVSVYFPDEVGEQIVDILGQRLPMETLKLDPIDVLVRKLRL